MADLSKATPRPWGYYHGYVWNTDGKGGMPLRLLPAYKPWVESDASWRHEAEANSALIVKAVNLHDELVAALREAVEAFEIEVPMGNSTIAAMRAVLAKVEATDE